jgi:hypothetical protein
VKGAGFVEKEVTAAADFDDEENRNDNEASDAVAREKAGLPSGLGQDEAPLDNCCAQQGTEKQDGQAGGQLHECAHPESGLALAELVFHSDNAGIIFAGAVVDGFQLHGMVI